MNKNNHFNIYISCRREGGTAQVLCVVDDRPDFANRARFPLAAQVLCDRLTQMRYRASFGPEALRGGKFGTRCQ